MLKIGDAVKFFRYETADGKSDYVSYNAIVLGVRPDGKINLVCLNPGDLQHLQGAEWQLCMTRHFDILPENSAGAAVDFYREASEPKEVKQPSEKEAKELAEVVELRSFLLTNFKNETGDETPVQCAIRLLGKTKKK